VSTKNATVAGAQSTLRIAEEIMLGLIKSTAAAIRLGSVIGLLVAAPCALGRADPPPPADDPSVPRAVAPADVPPPLSEYMGRSIARTMHYTGAPWLVRGEREREERASVMLKALGVKPGQVVCDLGCGNGYHTLTLAKMVGSRGRVFAVDVQREMLLLLKQRAKENELANIELVHGLYHDPKLPEEKLDLVLMVDVYHEFSHPEHMLRAIYKALKPTGRIALVEFRAEDPKVPIKPEHKMTKEQILKEFRPNGFRLASEYDKLPWQHLMFFQRDEQSR
jgi:ubiquinone/menaquinone biosynthesis C-methylase UbiE